MTPEQWRRVFAIVKASQDLPEGERGSFLAQQCANDEEVHGAARSLILAQGQMGSFLEGSTERANSPNADANQALSRGSSTAKGNEPSALPLGTNLGRYVVQDLLGSGGMGVVYAAYDPELDRKVAIKLLHPKASNRLLGSEGRSWLLREAQAMARLYHPNVVSVYDVGRFEEQVFVAMEFVDGTTLNRWLKEKTRSWREVLSVFREAGSGLAAAHGAGIVHRDFKPGNVLVSKDEAVKVTDFGLAFTPSECQTPVSEANARAGGLESPDLPGGGIAGTLGYMAPEQLRGEPLDARADQYSFCVALYEALIREHPAETNTFSTLSAQLEAGHANNDLIQAPRGASVPRWVLRPIIRGLSEEPGDRFDTLDGLLKSLEDQSLLEWMFIATRA